jgi:putative transposase
VSVFGALEYRSGLLTTALAPASDAAQFLAFLDRVTRRWPDKPLVLVLDNASYHKTPTLRAWFAAHADRISVRWLPTYRPQLNLIERVWRFVTSKLAGHRFWNNLDDLQVAAQTILGRTRATFAAQTYPPITLGQDFCMPA